MEVTHINHVDTHAVIGGQKAEAFAITQNAEFFEVLSSTLYSDKQLAVVREVLCNAWDAHLMVNRPDLAVEVSISDTELVIRDFGPGIAPDKIIDIYCTYGNSTKTHDGKQTGGFGLGSKAPFAYTKHFTVVSCHKGQRSVYAASRGSSETDGKPDMRCMVRVPCGDDTGLTVTIPLLKVDHKRRFSRLVKDLTFMGGMKVKLDGEELPAIDYSEANEGFVVVTPESMGEHFSHGRRGFFARYGAVVYPISLSDERLAEALVDKDFLYGLSRDNAVIFTTPANSLGVTPSRESLSYTDKSVATLIGLFSEASEKTKPHIPSIMAAYAKIVGKSHAEYHPNPLGVYASAHEDGQNGPFREISGSRHFTGYAALNPKTYDKFARAMIGARSFERHKTSKATQKKIRAEVRAHLRKRYPHLKRFFNALDKTNYAERLYERHRATPERAYIYSQTKSVERFVKRFEDIGVELALARSFYGKTSTFDWDCADKFETGVKSIGLGAMKFNFVMSPSIAAAERYTNKNKAKATDKSGYFVLVKIRKSTDVDTLKATLNKMGVEDENIHDARGEVISRIPLEVGSEHNVIVFGTRGVSKFDGSNAKVFAYGSESGIHGFPSGTGSRDLHKAAVGSVLLVSNQVEVRHFEKLGLTSLFGEVAKTITEMATDPAKIMAVANSMDEDMLWQAMCGTGRSSLTYVTNFAKVAQMIGFELPDDSDLTDMEKLAVHYISSERSRGGSSRYGRQHITAAVNTFLEAARALLKPVVDLLTSPEIRKIEDSFYSYRLRDLNPVVLDAIMRAIFESTNLQLKLQTSSEISK